MSSFPRFATAVAGAALSLLLAAPAGASTVGAHGATRLRDAIPSDCSWHGALPHWVFLSCSNRPASQQWRGGADCYQSSTGTYAFVYGSIVTGNGTSAINCVAPRNVGFFPVS